MPGEKPPAPSREETALLREEVELLRNVAAGVVLNDGETGAAFAQEEVPDFVESGAQVLSHRDLSCL